MVFFCIVPYISMSQKMCNYFFFLKKEKNYGNRLIGKKVCLEGKNHYFKNWLFSSFFSLKVFFWNLSCNTKKPPCIVLNVHYLNNFLLLFNCIFLCYSQIQKVNFKHITTSRLVASKWKNVLLFYFLDFDNPGKLQFHARKNCSRSQSEQYPKQKTLFCTYL